MSYLNRAMRLSFGASMQAAQVLISHKIQHRIELHLCRLDETLFSLIMLAGGSADQPSRHKLQGPYHSREQAQAALCAISDALLACGYNGLDEAFIWRIPAQKLLRNYRNERQSNQPDYDFVPLGVMPELDGHH